jgi:hypothetical protein
MRKKWRSRRANPDVDFCFGEGFRMPASRDLSARDEGRRPKASQEIDAQSGVAAERVPEIFPERIDPLIGVERPQRVGSALPRCGLLPQTELDVYAPERWVDDALFRPEVRDAYRCLLAAPRPPGKPSKSGSQLTRRWRKADSNSPSHLNEKLR